ncbi:MAG: tetratricopeptide repeat protein [Anaerolineae bacterium]|nr:tetratricopeptide repeat protein [Anaerolineae bacterium]
MAAFKGLYNPHSVAIVLALAIVVPSLILSTPAIWAAGLINAFDIELARQWTMDTVAPSQSKGCQPGDDVRMLQRMRIWLDYARDHDSRRAFHQGALACLSGDTAAAETAWRQDKGDTLTTLFAAIAAFANGHMLDTPFADKISEYGSTRGVWSEHNQDIDTAIRWYDLALAYEPNAETAGRLAHLYHTRGDGEQERAVWQRTADAIPADRPDHWEALARLAYLEKDWPAAAQAYRQEAELVEPEDAYRLWMQSGSMWLRAKEYEQAQDAFRHALVLDPSRVDAYISMGETFRYQRQYDQAAEWYRRAQQADLNHYAPPYYLGLVARAQQRYDVAIAYFDQSLTLKPHNAWVLYYKAVTLDAMGRRGDAANVLAQAISQYEKPPESWLRLQDRWRRYPTHDSDPDHWWTLGREMESAREWAEAARLYHKGAELVYPPDDYRLLNREALMRRYLKEWEKAKAIYRDLIRRYPDRMDAYLGLGEVYRARKEYAQAAYWYHRAKEADPDSYAPDFYLGLTSHAQKRYEDALRYYQASLALRPGNPWVIYYKAQTLWTMGHHDDAIQALQEAIHHYKNPPKSWQSLLEKWQAELQEKRSQGGEGGK